LGVLSMKKNNSKFKNNGNNSMYNLNYRFDSLSPAGKCCGTALDLIKRYNDLAKEAGSAGNYVEMEVFRQYAEHYRKIVTEINERKNANQQQPQQQKPTTEGQDVEQMEVDSSTPDTPSTESLRQEPSETQTAENTPEVITLKPMSLKKKTLKIVEVTKSELPAQKPVKSKRVAPKAKKIEPSDTDAAV